MSKIWNARQFFAFVRLLSGCESIPYALCQYSSSPWDYACAQSHRKRRAQLSTYQHIQLEMHRYPCSHPGCVAGHLGMALLFVWHANLFMVPHGQDVIANIQQQNKSLSLSLSELLAHSLYLFLSLMRVNQQTKQQSYTVQNACFLMPRLQPRSCVHNKASRRKHADISQTHTCALSRRTCVLS